MTDSEAPNKKVRLQKRGEGRSPAYPFIPVQKALDRAQELFAKESAHYAPLKSAMAAWSYSPKSSGARQTLATMRYYGLVDVTGEGDGRMIRVSELARKILLDKREDDSEKRALIRAVALMPSAHKALHQEYPDGLPSDGTVHHFLVFRKNYNDSAANELIAEFKQTASFVGLYEPQNLVDKSQVAADSDEEDHAPIAVGDSIQWVSNGSDRFPGGALVEAIHASGEWLWVSENLETSGIPISEVRLLERGNGNGALPPPRPNDAQNMRKTSGLQPEPGQKPKVTLDGDVLTIVASLKMEKLPELKKKIEALEAFYNAG